MNDSPHLAHGLAGEDTPPDWPALTTGEVETLLQGYSSLGELQRIRWHSPRPLSAACLVDTSRGSVFVKRHHGSVRSVAALSEEHRFIAHLRQRGVAIPAVMVDTYGHTAVAQGEWIYEVHRQARGLDVYRDAISWSPPPNVQHALNAGAMLAQLHLAAADYQADQRRTHILVARSELIRAADPVAELSMQLPARPGLAAYLNERDWQRDFAELLAPFHAAVQPYLEREPPCWTHGDWHVSNLCWSSNNTDADVTDVLDFGLCAKNFALFDLATAIERNAIAWLALERGDEAAHGDIAAALIHGYRQHFALSRNDLHLLAGLMPLVHVDFALSEVEYFHAITGSREHAAVAYDTFLRGHAAWFQTSAGQSLLRTIMDSD